MALLKSTELLATLRDKIIGSSAISTYISTHFHGSTLSVYTGMDQKNPPGETNAPFCVFLPVSASLGETQDSHSYTFEVLVGVLDSTYEDWQSKSAIEMEGAYRLDDICHLMIEEFRELSSVQNWIADDINLQMDSITYFPMHLGIISLTSAFSNVLGYDIKLTGAE